MPFALPDDQIEAELVRVLDSRSFGRSTRQRALLRYLVDARGAVGASRLKENTIALDVFERDAATYDSATDGIVRVSVNRLRELLDRYYQDEGARATLRFEIQRGGYVPIIRRATPTGLPPLPRIAVLPLENFTGNPDFDALCDGLTEDIIDAMTRVRDTRIIARTSSFRFKGVAMDACEIARKLDVDALVEGSLQQVGDRLRVTAQMILGSDGVHLWSHAFDVAINERESLQLAVVDIMLRALGKRSGVSANDGADHPARETPQEVQRLIDQARGLHLMQTPDNLAYAETLAQHATELAPDYADAWFVLAMVRFSRRAAHVLPMPDQLNPHVSDALDRALELDPSNAQATSLSAYLLITDELRWEDALARARFAVTLAPNHAGVNGRLAFLQRTLGEFEQSVNTYQHVRSLDPLAPQAHYHLALALAWAGRADEALTCLANAAEVLGDSVVGRDIRCEVLMLTGELGEMIAFAEQSLIVYPMATRFAVNIAFCMAAMGDLNAARAHLISALAATDEIHQAFARMHVESAGPDSNEFFTHLLTCVKSQSPNIMLIPTCPLYRQHHADPRWLTAMHTLKFPRLPPDQARARSSVGATTDML